MLNTDIQKIVDTLPGKIGVYYKDLTTANTYMFNEGESFIAASVIKLPLLIAVLSEIKKGFLRRDDIIRLSPNDKVPGCGVLTLMHSGTEVTIKDLCNLMITISDNTATNILISTLGYDTIRSTFTEMGLQNTQLTRKLYDLEGKKLGKENYICPIEMGNLLERIYKGRIISEDISQEIADILMQQQLNSKIPHLLPPDLSIAHKTGEISGVTHDVGIVYSENPFILCFASSDTDVILAEEALRKIALLCYQRQLEQTQPSSHNKKKGNPS